MAGFTEEKTDSGLYEINITPFVDVVLVLLILFMLSTPALVEKGLKISLPRAVSGEDISHVTLRVAIDSAGNLQLDKRPVGLEGIEKAIGELSKKEVVTDALISADRSVTHGRVMEVSDLLRRKGVLNIGFATETKK